jgi:hypothetical protein
MNGTREHEQNDGADEAGEEWDDGEHRGGEKRQQDASNEARRVIRVVRAA